MLPALKPKWAVGLVALAAMCFPISTFAQDQRWDHDWNHTWDHDRGRVIRVDQGMTIPIRVTETINPEANDQHVYHGVVAQDVMGDGGRVAIQQGSPAELRVRVGRDNDLVMHLEAIIVHGDRYGTATDPNRIQANESNTLVGNIVGAITHGHVGEAVVVQQGTVVTFRLDRPLEIIRHWD
jgi:hypothetical protein